MSSVSSQTTSADDVSISKLLSKILRHKALEMGLPMDAEGYVKVSDLLRKQQFRGKTIEDISRVVQNCRKQRFGMKVEEGVYFIRARQGHSIEQVTDEGLLTPIENASELPVCIHGTYEKFMDSIMATGLDKRGRNHIHMASDLPHLVSSGARYSSDVLIYINVQQCLENGLKFLRSENGVILCAGPIPSEYFEKVERYRSPSMSMEQRARNAEKIS